MDQGDCFLSLLCLSPRTMWGWLDELWKELLPQLVRSSSCLEESKGCLSKRNTSTHGDLVTVNNRREQAFLNTIVRENSTNFWIGLYGLIWEDTFLRTDNSHRRYTNWNVNEPSKHNQSMECVLMNPHKDEGRWRTASCSQRNGFICEIGLLRRKWFYKLAIKYTTIEKKMFTQNKLI